MLLSCSDVFRIVFLKKAKKFISFHKIKHSSLFERVDKGEF